MEHLKHILQRQVSSSSLRTHQAWFFEPHPGEEDDLLANPALMELPFRLVRGASWENVKRLRISTPSAEAGRNPRGIRDRTAVGPGPARRLSILREYGAEGQTKHQCLCIGFEWRTGRLILVISGEPGRCNMVQHGPVDRRATNLLHSGGNPGNLCSAVASWQRRLDVVVVEHAMHLQNEPGYYYTI